MNVKSEDKKEYIVDNADDAIIEQALQILRSRVQGRELLNASGLVKDYLMVSEPQDGREHFKVLFLSSKYELIAEETLSIGTLNQASVYPREVARKCLEHHAAAVVFSHNHPSGLAEPSQNDIKITRALKKALELFDVMVVDHVIVASGEAVSLAERNLI